MGRLHARIQHLGEWLETKDREKGGRKQATFSKACGKATF